MYMPFFYFSAGLISLNFPPSEPFIRWSIMYASGAIQEEREWKYDSILFLFLLLRATVRAIVPVSMKLLTAFSARSWEDLLFMCGANRRQYLTLLAPLFVCCSAVCVPTWFAVDYFLRLTRPDWNEKYWEDVSGFNEINFGAADDTWSNWRAYCSLDWRSKGCHKPKKHFVEILLAIYLSGTSNIDKLNTNLGWLLLVPIFS